MGNARKRGILAHKKKIAAIAAIALIGGGFFYGQNVAKERAITEATKNLVNIELTRGDIVRTVSGTGSIISDEEKEISVPVGTRIEKLYVKAGDRVKKGDKIAKLDELSVKEQLLKIDLAIDSKKTEIDDLDKKDDHYELKKEIAGAQLDKLKEDREKLEKYKDKSVIKASATGILSSLSVEEGDTVGGSTGISDTSGSSGGFDQDLLNAYLNMSKAGEGPQAYVKDIAMYTQSPDENENGLGNELKENDEGKNNENGISGDDNTGGPAEDSKGEQGGRNTAGAENKRELSNTAQGREGSSGQEESIMESSSEEDEQQTEETETEKSSDTNENKELSPIIFDSINLSIKAPTPGAARQSSISLDKDLRLVPTIRWIGQDNGILMAVVTLTAENGYFIEGKEGEIKVNVDSCKNAVSASYDTNADGKIDSIVTICPYVMNGASAEEMSESVINEYARQQALKALSELSKEYPKLRKEIDKEIDSLGKKLQKASKEAVSSLAGKGADISSSLSSLMGGAGNLSSLMGGADLSSLTSSPAASYNYQTAAIARIVPIEKAFISIGVNEMDINEIKTGQKAHITVDALEDQVFEGEIVEVSELSEKDTGKYTVKIKLDKTEQMRFGMNASAEIEINRKNNILMLPLEAIQTLGGKDVVYTGAEKDGTLISPVEISTGISDGENAEILEGLEQGQEIYYFKVQNTYNPFRYDTEDEEQS